MSGFLNVSASPHIRGGESTRSIMYDVALALLPATAFGVYRFGIYSLAVLIVSVGFAILAEYMYQNLTGQKITISDGSALVTGLLLGLNMPPAIPLWIPALGSIFAIVVVKQIFGGLGQNFMNPALGARCFLLISFGGLMGNFAVDGVSSPTPLAFLGDGKTIDLPAAFLGFTGGTIGEVSALAILIGGIYLLVKRIITWEIPVCYIGTFAVFLLIFGGHGFDLGYIASEICAGGLMLGAFFMATDYVTSPITKKGKIVFGILLGILTGVFRVFGGASERVSYAIIIANLLVPLIEKVTMPVTFGFEKGNPLAPAKPEKKKETAEEEKTDNAAPEKSGMTPGVYKASVSLCVITLVAGMALGTVYQMTKGPIEKAQLAAETKAFQDVMPDADSFAECEELAAAIQDAEASGPIADGTYGKVSFSGSYAALDQDGNTIGYAVKVNNVGYGGEIVMSVGVDLEGKLTGIEFTTINETAGLGMRAKEDDFRAQYLGKAVDEFELVKQPVSADNQVQAISGASVTSTAVTNSMNAVLYVIHSMAE